MRIQEYNTGSKFNEQDLLSGSEYLEPGKYRTKNFKLKDILTNIKAGLPAKEGVLSIKLISQEPGESQQAPQDLINQNEEGLYIPPYAVTIVKMLNGAVYLFSRTDKEFGANAYQCGALDFILLNPSLGAELSPLGEDLDYFDLLASDTQKDLNRALNEVLKSTTGQNEYENNFSVQSSDNSKLIFVETGGANLSMFLPISLPAGFDAEFLQIGEGTVIISAGDPANIVGKNSIGGNGKIVRIIKRKKDNKIHVI